MPKWRDDLFIYISGILKSEADYPLAVNGWKDHVHLLFEQKPSQSTSDILRVVKASSSKWINDQRLTRTPFAWQAGFGSFSYARNDRDHVINYIRNQETHHTNKTFREEYIGMLNDFEIPYDPGFLFKFFE